MSISWDLDDQRMLTREQLSSLIAEAGDYVPSVRLRESNALELQQRMLSEMGRVGLLSKMPFTFPVDVAICTAEPDGSLKQLDLPSTSTDGGVCITGRDGTGDVTRLILTEPSVDEILRVIPGIDPATVHERSREALERLKDSLSFRSELQSGLGAPGPTPKGGFQQLKVASATPTKEGEKQKYDVVALIARNPGDVAKLGKNDLPYAGIIVVLTDKEPDATMEREGLMVSESVAE